MYLFFRRLKQWEVIIVEKRMEIKKKPSSDHVLNQENCDPCVAFFDSEVQSNTLTATGINMVDPCSDRLGHKGHKPLAELGPEQSAYPDEGWCSKKLKKRLYTPTCLDLLQTSFDDTRIVLDEKRVEEFKHPDKAEMVPSYLSLDKVVELVSAKLVAPVKENNLLVNTAKVCMYR